MVIGEIGLLPADFYEMEIADNQHLLRGYNRRVARTERMVRRAVTVVVNLWASKKVDEKDLWAVSGDHDLVSRPKISEKQLEQLARLRLNQKLDG